MCCCQDEVMSTLAEVDKPAHAPHKKRPAGGTLQERWQQMDWDHDGEGYECKWHMHSTADLEALG